jgi:hypothetical protein
MCNSITFDYLFTSVQIEFLERLETTKLQEAGSYTISDITKLLVRVFDPSLKVNYKKVAHMCS